MMSLFLSTLFFTIIVLNSCRSSVGQSADPCTNPRPLGSSGKRSILYDPGTCDGRLCDNYIQEGAWYTLDGDTTGNRMPESCVPVWHCGTYIPIWMNGAHPTADSPGPVTVPVCAQQNFNGDCCVWRDQIRVKYCNSLALGEYYVYQLKIPPYCDMAYCGGTGMFCPSGTAWNEIKANCTNPRYPPVSEDPVLSSPYISDTKTVTDINGNAFTARKFSVKCTFRYQKLTAGDDGARFDVIFEAGGQAVAKYTLTSTTAVEYVAVMDESYLAGHLDNYLRCKVAAYWQSPYPARSTRVSNQIYYGLQTLDSNGNVITSISISEAQRVTIQIQATFPITTPWCFNIPNGIRCNPSYLFRIFSDKLLLSSCTFELSFDKPKSSSITLSPIPTPGTVSQPYNWPMYYQTDSSTPQTDDSIFRGYKSSTINVNIIDLLPQKVCQFTGDPHVSTFNYLRYYNLYLEGDFYLARVSERQLEIQVRTISCTIGREISCTCGVMVREGNNIVGINNCGVQSPQLIRYLKDLSNPGGTILNSGSSWTIKLISGVEIRVVTWGSRYFHVYVYGLGNENYDGLCSYSGPQTECASDCQSDNKYRVPVGDSMFRFSSTNLPQCRTAPILPTCDCRNGGTRNVPCYSPDQSNLLLTDNTCNAPSKRRKRETAQPSGETYFDIDLFASNITINLDFGKNPVNPVWPTPKGITQGAATDQCNSAARRSPAYTYCTTVVNVSISEISRTCALDIQLSDDLKIAEDSIASQVELLCQYKVKVEAVQTKNGSDEATQKQEELLNTMLCDSQCNQKGTCTNGVCRCNPGYTGSSCSLREGQVPTITGSLTGTCDVRVGSGSNACLQVRLEVNQSDTSGVTCKVRNSTGQSYVVTSPQGSPAGQVICNLQPSPVGTNDPSVNATTNYTIFVSVSNNGSAFSNEWQFIIYDSLCVSCTDRDCTPKTSSCAIRGRCYKEDDSYQCTKVLTAFCKPNVCSTRWMTKNSGSCTDGFDVCPSSSPQMTSVGMLVLAVVMTMTHRIF